MAIFSFGVKGSTEGKYTSAGSTEQKNATENTAQTQAQQATTSSLDTETQETLKALIQSLAQDSLGGENEALTDLVTLISNRASGSSEAISEQINPIMADARLQGEQQLQKLQTQLAQQSGGSIANTLVASSTGLGRANLESGLAKTRGELTLAGRQAETEELNIAVNSMLQAEQAKQAPIESIANLLNVLKGSTVQQTQSAESNLNSVLDSLTTKASYEKSRTKTFSGAFGFGQ